MLDNFCREKCPHCLTVEKLGSFICLFKSLSNLVKASTSMTEWQCLVGFSRLGKDELQNEEPQSSLANVNLEDFSKCLYLKINLNKFLFKLRISTLFWRFYSFQLLCYWNDRKLENVTFWTTNQPFVWASARLMDSERIWNSTKLIFAILLEVYEMFSPDCTIMYSNICDKTM